MECLKIESSNFVHGLYSWVIVCASFLNCSIVGTIFVGFSILYVEISEYFGSSKGAAGWGSLYIACGKPFGEKCHILYCFTLFIIFSIVALYLSIKAREF